MKSRHFLKRDMLKPFITGDSFSVPLKKRAEVIQTEGPAAVTVGDEKIAVAQIRRITTVDSDPFVKLFVAELDRFLFDLSPSALRIVTVLIQSIGKLRVGDGDQVFINERAISDTLMQHGLPAPSSATYYRVIEELIAKGFIAPSENTHLFFFNPAIFFNGDRVRFVTEIRRKKASAQERLERQGQTALQLDQPSKDG